MSTHNDTGGGALDCERNALHGNTLPPDGRNEQSGAAVPPAGDASPAADLVVEIRFPVAPVAVVRADTDAGREWLREHVSPDGLTLAGRVACEQRYLPALVGGARDAGLLVEADR